MISQLFSKNILTSSCLLLATLAAALSAQAGTSTTNLPLEKASLGSGKVTNVRAYETSERLYIAGSARQHPLSSEAHVDIQLIGADGAVIAEKQDKISAPHAAPGGGKRSADSFTASFPIAEAQRAQKVRIVFRGNSHAQCQAGQSS